MALKDDLKQRRIELNLTMAEVAKKVGVSEATISRMGKRRHCKYA